MLYYKVPFYANTRDDTHCVRAVFRMVLKYFLPKKNFSRKELDRMSRKEKDLGTWLVPALIKFVRMGFDVINIEPFDYRRYHKEDESYIRKIYPDRIAEWYLEKSNLKSVKKYIPQFLQLIKTQKRYAKLNDIYRLIDDGYLVASDVNSDVLNGRKGYNSHIVLIIGYDRNYFILHDPGLPPYRNRKITRKLFRRAWSKKYASGPNLTAFLLQKKSA